MKAVLIAGAVLLILEGTMRAQEPDKSRHTQDRQLNNSAGAPRWQVLDINNLWTWHRSDGEGNHSPTGAEGLSFPKFTGHCIYEDNVIVGGKVYVGGFPETGGTLPATQHIRVNGGEYLSNHGMDEGWVEGFGASASPVDKNLPEVRIYRIRRDYFEMSDAELTDDAAVYYEQVWAGNVTDVMIQQIRDQYHRDWQEWPVEHGAPYIERNGIPGYQAPPPFTPEFTLDSLILRDYDEPGVAGENNKRPADQVLFTVFNVLRSSRALGFAQSLPMGIEIQKTVWGYKSNTSLGYHFFMRCMILNKGGVDIGGGQLGAFHIDSLYFAQWSDPDIGRAGDDLAGCDSLLGLGYAYNADPYDDEYASFGLPPPSVGYAVLAGPLVDGLPSDSGVKNFQRVYGKKNLALTSFGYRSQGSFGPDPIDEYAFNTGQRWKMLRGFRPTGSLNTQDQPYDHPPGYPITKFPLSGDPVVGTGFLDGLGTTYSYAPGDRRIQMNTGPFRLAPGDTAEVVLAVMVGMGADHLSSIEVMKANTRLAREAFESLFDVPGAPQIPVVDAGPLDKQIVLLWGEDQAVVEETEQTKMIGGYRFEGYNVYQLPGRNRPLSEGIKIATYDVINGVTTIRNMVYKQEYEQKVAEIVQEGTDKGVQHTIKITWDELDEMPLYNGREYHFAVTAYNYTADENTDIRSFESAPARITVIPQIPFGIISQTTSGDSLEVTHISGSATTPVHALVVDPTRNTGETYEVRFDTALGQIRASLWSIERARELTAAPHIDRQHDLQLSADGIEVIIAGGAPTFTRFEVVANGAGPVVPSEQGCFAFNLSGFPYLNGSDRPGESQQVGPGEWGIHTASGGSNDLSFAYFISRTTENGSRWPVIGSFDYEIRFTSGGSIGFQPNAFVTGAGTGGTVLPVPFELWNIGVQSPNDPSDDFRLFPYVFDSNQDGVFNLAPIDHPISGGDNDPETDWFCWVLPADQSFGQTGYEAIATDVSSDPANHTYLGFPTSGTDVLRRMVLVNWNGGSVSDATFPININQLMPEQGTVFRITTSKVPGPGDVYRFSVPPLLEGLDITKASAQRVGVYPNPYYTGWSYSSEIPNQFVTFNNLPEHTVIRIFNLAGQLVRTLEKQSSSQFQIWDLRNESNQPVASGIYVCFVEMPDIGELKVLKLAIVQTNMF